MKRVNKRAYLRWLCFGAIFVLVFVLGMRYEARRPSTSVLNTKTVNLLAGAQTDAQKALQSASGAKNHAQKSTERPRTSGLVTLTGNLTEVSTKENRINIKTTSGQEYALSLSPKATITAAPSVAKQDSGKKTSEKASEKNSERTAAKKLSIGDLKTGDKVRLAVTAYGDGSFLVQSIRVTTPKS